MTTPSPIPSMQSNGQQRPANPFRFAVWRARPFPDGRPPTAEFSLNVFIPLDVLKQLYDAIGSGLLQPEQDQNGVPGVKLWGNGYRGTGAPTATGGTSPVMSGNFGLPKVLWQQQQAAQQQQPQVAPAYAQAFPPQQQQPAPQQAPAAAPAPAGPWAAPELPQQQAVAPQPATAPAQQGWGQQPGSAVPAAVQAANQWATQPPADL